MKAVVMAGGSGTRLRPLTLNRPKPMVPVANKPVIAHILDLLKRHGIVDVVITLQYMAEDVQDFFGDGQSLGMNIVYSIEESPLGTAGSVKQAAEYLDDTFLVISGDAVTDLDLSAVIDFHQRNQAKATLTLYRVPNPLEYGVIIVDGEGRIQQFQEKPSWGEVISDTVNTGIYVLEPEVLDLFEPEISFDFSRDLFPMLLERGDPMYGYISDGYWCDVGNLSEYMRATSDVLEGRVKVEPLGDRVGDTLWRGRDVEIAPDAQIEGGVYLGTGVKIKGGVVIHGPTVIRDYTVVDNNALVERSVVWRNCYIGEGAELHGAIVGRQCSLKGKSVVFEGAVVGDSSVIDEGAVIHPGVKIWPGKEVEAGATVKTSIIWGSQGRRVLFGRYGVTGLVNVDLTPEFAARIGAAFAATLPLGSNVIINRDLHRSPRMIKRALISGLPSAGVNVVDVRNVPIPVARYMTGETDAEGGMHVRLSPYDSRVVDIKFFDAKGQDLDRDAERNIERVFFREDFRRVYLDEIGTIRYSEQVRERYTREFVRCVDVDLIAAANPYIVVDFASAPTVDVLNPLLARMHVRVAALNAALEETKMSIPSDEFQQALGQLARICTALDTAMGVRLDVGGERIFVVDDQGRSVSAGMLTAAMAILALRANGGGTVAVPVTLPNALEQIAAQYGGSVLRTRTSSAAIQEAANRPGVILAADGRGSFVFPDFQPVVDGMMAVARLLEYLTRDKVRLSDVLREVPEYHLATATVNCPWENKGTVMRLLNQQYKERLDVKIDGVKILLGEDEWVLVLPDEDQPRFQIHAQGHSETHARDLVERYVRIVEGLQD